MNDAHLHLLVNHFPIIGLFLGTLILLAGLIFRSRATRVVSLFVILVSASFSFIAFSSGEGAEEVVEHMSSMTREGHDLIHEHEEEAEGFMPFVWGLLILCLAGLFMEWKKMKFALYVQILVLLIALAGCYAVSQVGNSGGEISHPEIRKGFVEAEHEEHD